MQGSATGPGDQYVPLTAQRARERALDAHASPAVRCAAVSELLQHGLLRDASEALDQLGDAAEAGTLRRLVGRLWQGEALLADAAGEPAVTPRKCSSVMVAPAQGATRCLVVFSGIAMVPYPSLPAFAARAGCHLVFLFDPTRRFLLGRTPRLGATYEETVATLRRVVAALGGPALHCVGISSGGYPALRLGLELGAHGVLAFSGPTTIDMNDDPGAPMSKYPQLVGVYRSVPHLVQGVGTPYAQARSRPRVILIHGAAHERDTFMAHLLADRVGPEGGVSLRPLPGFAEHDTFSEFVRQGWFDGAIDELLALEPYAAEPAPAA